MFAPLQSIADTITVALPFVVKEIGDAIDYVDDISSNLFNDPLGSVRKLELALMKYVKYVCNCIENCKICLK